MTARCPGTVAAKQAQIITPPPLCLTPGMRNDVFGFWPPWCCVLWPIISTLVLSVQKHIVPEVLWFVHIQNFKPTVSCAVMLFLVKRGFLQPLQTSHTCYPLNSAVRVYYLLGPNI